MSAIFDEEARLITNALKTIDDHAFREFVNDCAACLRAGRKIVATGLGKNVPICEKFVGTMTSLGLPAAFMHTNSAIHGDLGLVNTGDIVIMLTKSGETMESIHLNALLSERAPILWLLTFSSNSSLAKKIAKKILVELEHEGDAWNIVPNNSSIVNLIILQKLCSELVTELNINIIDFKRNHPGGHIGQILGVQR